MKLHLNVIQFLFGSHTVMRLTLSFGFLENKSFIMLKKVNKVGHPDVNRFQVVAKLGGPPIYFG